MRNWWAVHSFFSYLNVVPTSNVQIATAVCSRPDVDILLDAEGGVERHPDVLARATDDDLHGFIRIIIWDMSGTPWEVFRDLPVKNVDGNDNPDVPDVGHRG